MRLKTGDTEQILALVLASDGSPAVGRTTIRVRVLRTSDHWLLDFSDSLFKAAGHVTLNQSMTEIDATNAQGIYELSGGFNTGSLPNSIADDMYVFMFSQTSGTDVLPSPGTVTVGQWADDIGRTDLNVKRVLGLTHENTVIDNLTYDAYNQPITGRMRVYDSKANAVLNDGATGLVAEYSINETYAGPGLMTLFRQARES